MESVLGEKKCYLVLIVLAPYKKHNVYILVYMTDMLCTFFVVYLTKAKIIN